MTQVEITRHGPVAHESIGEILEKLEASTLADPAIEEIAVRHAEAWADCGEEDDPTHDEIDNSCLGIVDVLEEMDWLASRSSGARDALVEIAAALAGNGYSIEELPADVIASIG